MNWLNAQSELKKRGLKIFGPRDLARLFGVSRSAVSFFVHRNAKKGLLVRLKKSRRGSLYSLADKMPDQYEIANRLYEPSYISLDTALSHYGIISETIYGITSITPKTTRRFNVEGIVYSYFRVKRRIFTGYRPIEYANTIVLMAEPEKALADYLYFVDLKKRGLHYERLNLKKIAKKRLIRFVKFYQRTGMLKLVEEIYAQFRKSRTIY